MQNLHKKLTKFGNKRERMREKSDLWGNTNIADMHALLEGSWAATGQLCLSCCRLCLELTSCSCTVPPLPWDTPVTFLWQTRQLPMFPSVQMLQCFSLVGVLRCCIIRVQLSVQMLNCTKPEQGQGSQTWCSLSAHLCHVYAYINPIFFLRFITSKASVKWACFRRKCLTWEKASEFISFTNTAGSGPITTLESSLIWQC